MLHGGFTVFYNFARRCGQLPQARKPGFWDVREHNLRLQERCIGSFRWFGRDMTVNDTMPLVRCISYFGGLCGALVSCLCFNFPPFRLGLLVGLKHRCDGWLKQEPGNDKTTIKLRSGSGAPLLGQQKNQEPVFNPKYGVWHLFARTSLWLVLLAGVQGSLQVRRC